MLSLESNRLPRSWPQPLLLLLIVLVTVENVTCPSGSDDSEPVYAPAFPDPLDTIGGRLYVLSEEFDSHGGYLTREEYVDLSIGKATFSITKSGGRETFHMDAATQSTYYYTPYQCTAYQFPSKPPNMAQSGFRVSEKWTRLKADQGEPKRMYLTGVTAIWLNARSLPRNYTHTPIYSQFIAGFDTGHKWTTRIGDTTASFTFKGNFFDFTLEMIELETGVQKTTINVLAYEFELEDSAYEKELQLPLSYGCYQIGEPTEEVEKLISQIEATEMPDRLQLEAVATRLFEGGRRSAETVGLEIIHSPSSVAFVDGKLSVRMQSIRQRNSKTDNQTVIDHILNVKYDIDHLRGTCQISSAGEALPLNETKITVSFPNGLSIKLDQILVEALFSKLGAFKYVKSVEDEDKGVRYVYMTVTNVHANIWVRIVRKYSIRDQFDSVKLDSVTIWIMNESPSSKSDIREHYHFTILESNEFDRTEELASVFDISEACYLDNEKEMKYGRDYAWLELHYSVAQNVLYRLSAYWSGYIRQMFYDNMQRYAHIGFPRLPRLELLFDEVGFTIRFVLLDSPPLHMIFDREDGMTIEPDAGETQGYFREIAPDLRHCSELCRLNRCLAFSFCEKSYSCVLAHPSNANQSSTAYNSRTQQRSGCSLFREPSEFEYLGYHESRLHNFIGQIQRHDLDSLVLPQPPEELLVPRSESGLSVREEAKLQLEYERTVRKHLAGIGLNAVSLLSKSLIGVPDRFELEQDPLAEFELNGKDELQPEDEWLAPAFHEGLSQFKFNYRAFVDGADSNVDQDHLSSIDGSKREARRYIGVDYQQCELACVDGKCSSFSYCQQRQECTITNIWDLQSNKDTNLIQADADCAIAQRDFLSKFHKLSGVKQPSGDDAGAGHVAAAINPSECAHGCVVESGFNCLAFTYCRAENSAASGTCYFAESRTLQPSQVLQEDEAAAEQTVGCDHYSRSYLADFTRIEYREIQPDALDELKTSLVDNQSVDRCAELCATELMDCTAFQFCYDPEQQESRQRCTMIESPPTDKKEDYRVVLDEYGQVSQAGKLFASNQNCHVFSLRRGSSEAELRQLALNPLSKSERGDQDAAAGPGGMSLVGGLILFLVASLLFISVGVAFVVAQRSSPQLRSRLDHLRALAGRYY